MKQNLNLKDDQSGLTALSLEERHGNKSIWQPTHLPELNMLDLTKQNR